MTKLETPTATADAIATKFQGPGMDVKVGVPEQKREPQQIDFDPDEMPPAKKNQAYIPKKWAHMNFDSGSHKNYAQWAEDYGLAKVKIIPLYEGHTGGVTGLNGRCLEIGDIVEMPVNYAVYLVQQGSAVFVLSSETAQDEKLIAELEAKGYLFATTQKPAREREEFQHVIARKKTSKWMAGTVMPLPSNA